MYVQMSVKRRTKKEQVYGEERPRMTVGLYLIIRLVIFIILRIHCLGHMVIHLDTG